MFKHPTLWLLPAFLITLLSLKNSEPKANGEKDSLPELVLPLGHTARISSVEFSYDDTRIISGSDDNTIKIWDVASRKLFASLPGSRFRLSPQGNYIACITASGETTVYDFATCSALYVLPQNLIEGLTYFSHDEKYLLTTTYINPAIMWDVRTGTQVKSLDQCGAVRFARFGNQSDNLILIGNEISYLYNYSTGTTDSLAKNAYDAVFTRDDAELLIATYPRVEIWNVANKTLRDTLQARFPEFVRVNFSPDYSDIITSRDYEDSLKVWNAAAGRYKFSAPYFPDSALHHLSSIKTKALPDYYSSNPREDIKYDFSSDSGFVVISHESFLYLWQTREEKYLGALAGQKTQILTALVSENGEVLVTQCVSNESPEVWSIADGSLLYTAYGGSPQISPDSKYLLTEYSFVDTESFDNINRFEIVGLRSNSTCFSGAGEAPLFSPDSRYFLFVSFDSVHVVQCGTWKHLGAFKGTNAHFSPDSRKLCIWNVHDEKEHVWDIETRVQIYSVEASETGNVTFSADCKYISAINSWISGVNNVYVSDGSTGELKYSFETDGWCNATSFSEDGSILYVLTDDSIVSSYDVLTGSFKEKHVGRLPITPSKAPYTISLKNSIVHFISTATRKEVFQFASINETGMWILPTGQYFCSPEIAHFLSWKKDDELYGFDQWDLMFNRPDLVLRTLGTKDTALISAYHAAWMKRVRKLKADTAAFRPDFHAPDIFISELPSRSVSSSVVLNINCIEDEKSNYIERINVSVNGVPVYGSNGLYVGRKKKNKVAVQVPIILSDGDNIITVSCVNNRSAESLPKTAYVAYEPPNPTPSKTYFIGIGISKYQDNSFNLTYAAKDAGDLANTFAGHDQAISVHLFLDEQATRENILRLKKDVLLNTNVNDKVIISFSGHGLINTSMDFYFATWNVNFQKPEENGLSYEDIDWLLDSIPARNKLVLMDACHSGEIDKEEMEHDSARSTHHPLVSGVRAITKRGFETDEAVSGPGLKNSFQLMQTLFSNTAHGNGTVFISAAAGTEFAFEGREWNNGVFSYAVMRGLTDTIFGADDNYNDIITVGELRKFVFGEVQKLTDGRQTPTTRQENLVVDWVLWKK